MINISELIADPSRLDKMTLQELKQIVDNYPFFQTARLLYVANLHKTHSSTKNSNEPASTCQTGAHSST